MSGYISTIGSKSSSELRFRSKFSAKSFEGQTQIYNQKSAKLYDFVDGGKYVFFFSQCL